MKEFKKIVKVKKILLILGIIICFIALSIYLFLNNYLKNEDVVYLNEVDKEYTSSDVEVTLLTDYFATLNESGKLERFYLVFDSFDNIFIVTLNDEDFNDLSEIHEYTYNDDIKEQESVIIKGRSKEIPEEIKNYALDYLIEMELDVNKDTIDNVVGKFYLDTTITNDYILNKLLIILIPLFIIGVLLILIDVIKILKRKNILKVINNKEINNSNHNSLCHIIITKNYLINYKPKLYVIKLDEILWFYPYEARIKKKVSERSIFILTKDNNKYNVGVIHKFDEEYENAYGKLYQDLVNILPDALKGYTKENKEQINEKFKK